MKKCSFWAFILSLAVTLPLTSCSSDDDDDNDDSGKPASGLVSASLPSEGNGFSAIPDDGKATFYVADNYDPEDGWPTYMAFDMKAGKVNDAVLNMVFSSDQEAKMMVDVLNRMTVDDLIGDDDEEDDDPVEWSAAKAFRGLEGKMIRLQASGRSGDRIDLQPGRSGKVVYFRLTSLKGISKADLRDAVNHWADFDNNPADRFIFGSYNEQTGVYTAPALMGLPGCSYKIETAFGPEGTLTLFRTSLTVSSEGLARLMEMEFADMEINFGTGTVYHPTVTREGNTVRVDAVIVGDMTREMTRQILYVFDWDLAKPFVMNF